MAGEGDQVSRRGFELCNSGHLGAFGWGGRCGGEEGEVYAQNTVVVVVLKRGEEMSCRYGIGMLPR
jgi:hypothetical protein